MLDVIFGAHAMLLSYRWYALSLPQHVSVIACLTSANEGVLEQDVQGEPMELALLAIAALRCEIRFA